MHEKSFDKSFVAYERSRSLVRNIRAHRIYGSTLSCPPGNYHRHHPATGQSRILFSKLPRLNQRIALNGALLVIPPSPPCSDSPSCPPLRQFTHELFIPSAQFCKEVRLSGSQSEIQVRDYNSAHRAVKTPSRIKTGVQGGVIFI